MKLRTTVFCEKYDISCELIAQYHHHKRLPDYIFSKSHGEVYVEESYFVRRYEFKKWVTNKCHEYYFYLERYFPASTISYMMTTISDAHKEHTWNMFFNKQLFSYTDYSILQYKIRPMMWEFFRQVRWILIHLFKMKGLKFSECNLDKVHNLKDIKCK